MPEKLREVFAQAFGNVEGINENRCQNQHFHQAVEKDKRIINESRAPQPDFPAEEVIYKAASFLLAEVNEKRNDKGGKDINPVGALLRRDDISERLHRELLKKITDLCEIHLGFSIACKATALKAVMPYLE